MHPKLHKCCIFVDQSNKISCNAPNLRHLWSNLSTFMLHPYKILLLHYFFIIVTYMARRSHSICNSFFTCNSLQRFSQLFFLQRATFLQLFFSSCNSLANVFFSCNSLQLFWVRPTSYMVNIYCISGAFNIYANITNTTVTRH